MFALRKIVDKQLYTLADEDRDSDEFEDCMANWSDTLYLFNFFKNNEHALEYYGIERSEAIELVVSQSAELFLKIREATEYGKLPIILDKLFIPLHKGDDFSIPIVEAKAYSGRKGQTSMLRLYAIRLQDGCYIFVGGLIKTTKSLQDCKEGREILKKIESFAKFLRKEKYTDSFEIRELLF